MKKRSKLVAIMLLVVLSVMKLSVCADGSPGHNKALIKVLFGNARVSDTDKMDSLNDALLITVRILRRLTLRFVLGALLLLSDFCPITRRML